MKRIWRVFICMGVSCFAAVQAAAGINADESKKEKYYREYKKIIEEANDSLGSEEFRLTPMDEVNEEDMQTPEEFQKTVDALMKLEDAEAVLDEGNDPQDTSASAGEGEQVDASQTKKMDVCNVTSAVKCDVSLTTRYNSSAKRRFVTRIDQCLVTVSGSSFHWKEQPVISEKIIDSGRTVQVKAAGVLENSSALEKQADLTYEFYCNSGGGIE